VLRAALRRFSLLLLIFVGGTALCALALGLAAGAGVSRSLSVGWYIVGSMLLVGGFFVGNRGAARPRGEGAFMLSSRRFFQWANADDQQESISLSAILVTLGFVLLVLGVVADTRYALF